MSMKASTPVNQSPKPANIGSSQINTNQNGIVLPYLAGTGKLPLIWITDALNIDIRDVQATTGKKTKSTVARDYYADVAGVVCHGPVDALEQIHIQGNPVWTGPLAREDTDFKEVTVPNYGVMRIYWGTETQDFDPTLSAGKPNPAYQSGYDEDTGEFFDNGAPQFLPGAKHPAYRGQCYVVWKKLYFGRDTTNVPNVELVLTRTPSCPLFSYAPTPEGVHPLLVACEWLTNSRYGLDRSIEEIIDVDSWTTLADLIDPANPANSGLPSSFCSPRLDKASPITDLLLQLAEYYDGWFRMEQGKLYAGYFPHKAPASLSGLPTITPADLADEPQPVANGWKDTHNQFQIVYVDRDGVFQDAAQSYFAQFNHDITKVINPFKIDEPWTITNTNAMKRLGEVSRIESFPSFTCSLPVKRERVLFKTGELILFTYIPLNISEAICRVTDITVDSDQTGVITVDIISERGVLPHAYHPPIPGTGTPPNLLATPIAFGKVIEIDEELSGTAATSVAVLAVRPSATTYGFKTTYSPNDPALGPATFDLIGNSNYFAALGRLDQAYGRGSNDFDPLIITLHGIDGNKVQSQSAAATDDNQLLLFIDNEIFSVSQVTPIGLNQYSVFAQRAKYSTQPVVHSPNVLCFFISRDQLQILDSAAFYSDTVGFFKLYAYTQRDEADPLLLSLKFMPRQDNPNQEGRLRISGLELDGQGNDHNFLGKDARFRWRLSNNTSNGLSGTTDSGIQSQFFAYYRIRIYSVETGKLLREELVLDVAYIYTFEKNWADTKELPSRHFTFEVAVKDTRFAALSAPASIEVQNPAPPVPSVTLVPFLAALEVKMSIPTDTDYKGVIVWMSKTSGFTPSALNKVYEGPDAAILVPLERGVRYYIRCASYDSFSDDYLNISPEFNATTLATLDTTPPAIPTGVVITASLRTGTDGTQESHLTVKWDANIEPDFRAYGFRIKETLGSPFSWEYGSVDGINSTTIDFTVKANTSYDFQINAVDNDNNTSNWSSTFTQLSTKDTVPPAAPTWISASLSFRSVYLLWDANTESDFSWYEIWTNTVDDFATATKIRDLISATSEQIDFLASALFAGYDQRFWLVAVDRSGNRSIPPSASIHATLAGVPTPTGLALATTIEADVDGTILTFLSGSVDASTYPEFNYFAFQVSTVSGAANYWTGTSTDGKFRIPVIGNTTFYVRAQIFDRSGSHGAFCAEVTQLSGKDTTPPAAPTAISAAAAIQSIFLEWKNDTAPDTAAVQIFKNTTNVFPGGTPWKTLPATPGGSDSIADGDTLPSTTYYYFFKSVDTSGNVTVSPSTSVNAIPASVGSSSIDDYSLGLTKFYHATIALAGDSWTDDLSGGTVSWNAHTVYYQGAGYAVASGNSGTDKYVWWDSASPTAYQHSASLPALTDGQFMIATNVAGAHDLAWNAMANALIGTAYIADAAVTNAKVLSLVVDKLTAGTISGQAVTIAGGTAGVIKSSGYVSGTAGWAIFGDGSAEFSNVVVRGSILGSTIQIGASSSNVLHVDINGNLWIGAATFGAAPFSVSNTGVLTAVGASISGSLQASSLAVGVAFTIGATGHTTDSLIQSFGFTAGSIGWRVRGNGDAEFNNITIRGAAIIGGTIGSTSTTTVETGANKANTGLDGSGNLTTNVSGTVGGTAAASVASGTSRALTAINGSFNLVTSVIPGVNAAPSGAGLYLGADYLGFYNSGWKTYMDNTGKFYLGGTSGALQWDGSTLTISGSILATASIAGTSASTVATGGARAAASLDSSNNLTTNVSGTVSGTAASTVATGAVKANTNIDGSGNYTSNLSGTVNGTAAATVATGAARAYTGLDNAGQLITAVLPTANIGSAPASTGLYMGADYMGFYNAGWKTFMDSNGNFYLGGSGGALIWNAGSNELTISGNATWKGVVDTSNSNQGVVINDIHFLFGDRIAMYAPNSTVNALAFTGDSDYSADIVAGAGGVAIKGGHLLHTIFENLGFGLDAGGGNFMRGLTVGDQHLQFQAGGKIIGPGDGYTAKFTSDLVGGNDFAFSWDGTYLLLRIDSSYFKIIVAPYP